MKNQIYLTLIMAFLGIQKLSAQQSQLENLQSLNSNAKTHLSQLIQAQNIDFQAYPNPTTNILNLPGNNDYDYMVFDMTGKRLQQGKNRNVIQIGKLPAGFYILKVYCSSGTWTKVIGKQD